MNRIFSRPIFVVGCSRSGTTLIQSILSNLPGRISFPETNILYFLRDDLDARRFGLSGLSGKEVAKMAARRLYNLSGRVRRPMRPHFLRYLERMGREDLSYLIPENVQRTDLAFQASLGMMAALSGGKPWIEKSPQNLFCIGLIQRYVPGARFVHVLRNGKETVGSIMDAAGRYDSFRDRFGGENGLQKAVAFYNNSLRVSGGWSTNPNHTFVRYEDVASGHSQAFQGVNHTLRCEIGPEQLNYQTEGITFSDEDWKKGTGRITERPSKFFSLSYSDQRYVEENILDVDAFFRRHDELIRRPLRAVA